MVNQYCWDAFFLYLIRYKGASGSSAVCSFTMDQVEKAFNGRYREVNRETQQWYTYNHPVPEPRPGMVSTSLLPSAGEPVDTYIIVISSMSCQLHEQVSYIPVCSSVTSSILTDDQRSNRYIGAGVTPHLTSWTRFLSNVSCFHFLAGLLQVNH